MSAEPVPGLIARACPAVHAATESDAIAGVQPRFVAEPTSTTEVSALLRAASELSLAVVPRGAGTRLHWGYPPHRADIVLAMTSLDQLVEHAAGDLLATVQAGVTLDRLAHLLGAAGQRLALDPPRGLRPGTQTLTAKEHGGSSGVRGTIGGVLATGVAGPLRLRYGTPRDLLLGVTMVRADGTVARAGGKVVKNVAGYDIGRLLAGSRGTLAVITEATFRLHPVPAATALVTIDCDAAVRACQLVALALRSDYAPASADIDWPSADAPVRASFMLEGSPAGVASRAAALAEELNREHDQPPASAPSGEADPGRNTSRGAGTATVLAPAPDDDTVTTARDGTSVQVSFWPGDLGMVLGEIRAAARAVGLDPAVSGSAGTGVIGVMIPADADSAAIAAFVTALRESLRRGLPYPASHRPADLASPAYPFRAHGQARSPSAPGPRHGTPRESPPARASVVVLYGPAEVTEAVDLFGPLPSVPVMRAIKRQFDPAGILSPGRFAGGI